ncbi:SDR family oxidoreductase [Silvanigrella sp.]|jgi:UDP-glucose 4-epimerase|uniref:SDR family oxidoreductase n=1 Tax=Silvanigrella sp. TaxID=2024976 RepID=UPI0037CB1B6A
MKAIVTGGAGFIGSHLVDQLLKNNFKVTVIDNLSTGRLENISHIIDKIRFIECDISNYENLSEEFENADYVFHIAALADIVPSIQNPVSYYEANAHGTFRILEASKNLNLKKFIYVASSSCYGIPSNYPTNETSEISPQYPYALTKRMGEELVMHWGQVYKIPVISFRLFNVYGTRSRTSGTYGAVFGVFLAQKLAGHPLTVVGDGNQTRDFTYVSDVTNALFTGAMSAFSNEIYNVGSGQTVSVNRLVELLECEKIYIPKRPGEPDCTFADISKIKKDLNWTPKVTIENGVHEILKNIDYWQNAPVWTQKSIEIATKDWFKFLGSQN